MKVPKVKGQLKTDMAQPFINDEYKNEDVVLGCFLAGIVIFMAVLLLISIAIY